MPDQSDNNWYVLTGGPSSGKTTLLHELAKVGYSVMEEAARTYFNQQLATGLTIEEIRADEEYAQNQIAKMKIKIEEKQPKNVATFFDRGMQDTLAYMRFYGYKLKDFEKTAMKKSKYKKVFLLDPLPVFEQDDVRSTEPPGFADKITAQLRQAYEEFGMKVVRVPVMPVPDRVQFILDNIKAK